MLYTQRYEADLIKNPFSASERQIPLLKIWLPINKQLKPQKNKWVSFCWRFQMWSSRDQKVVEAISERELQKDPDHKMIRLWEVLA